MAIDNRVGTKVQKNLRREESPGTRVDPYPYIGIVKNNLDPTRSGRMQVFIPDLGGNPNEPKNWRTVSYSSPYMGTTPRTSNDASSIDTSNEFDSVSHSYGMWMIPPDLEVEVIVIFIGGDPLRGYWIGCVNSNLSKHMMPGIAGSASVDLAGASVNTKTSYRAGTQVPVTEFNDSNKNLLLKSDFYNNPKPIHEYQYDILKKQGLDTDRTRGAITSSSQRETPSNVFGISTPGRPLNDPAEDPTFLSKLASGKITEKDYRHKTRKGGHTFILDDGSANGTDKLVRLRTAEGHQLLMHDTNKSIYLAHADGTSWIEMTKDGKINIYSKSSISVRTENSLNFKADKDINIDAGNNLNIRVGSKLKAQAGSVDLLSASNVLIGVNGSLKVNANGGIALSSNSPISVQSDSAINIDGSVLKLQSGGAPKVTPPTEFSLQQLSDTKFNSTVGVWENRKKLLSTVVTVAPTHEPFARNEVETNNYVVTSKIQPAEIYKDSYDATKNVNSTPGKGGKPTDKDLRDQPPCDCTVGNLETDQLTAYFAAIGKSESGGFNPSKFSSQYEVVNTLGYCGKYQFGALALNDLGYVRKDVRSLRDLDYSSSWTGKNGINSKADFLGSPAEQEKAMCAYTKMNYSRCCNIGAIDKSMPPEEVAGMLAIAHLLGPGGARDWRQGKGGADAYGTTGTSYFQKGRYAIAVLAPKLPTINAG